MYACARLDLTEVVYAAFRRSAAEDEFRLSLATWARRAHVSFSLCVTAVCFNEAPTVFIRNSALVLEIDLGLVQFTSVILRGRFFISVLFFFNSVGFFCVCVSCHTLLFCVFALSV